MTEKTRIENPLILALDTTQSALCLALQRGAEVLASVTDHSSLPHSQRLFPLLDQLLKFQTLSIHEIDLLAVNTGPGSFTGLRVGIAAVKGLATTWGKPALGVNAFDAWALAAGVTGVPIVVLLNAAKEELYVGLRWVEADLSVRSLQADGVKSFALVRRELLAQFADSEVVLMGSGAVANESELRVITTRWRVIAAPDSLTPTIGAAALQHWRAGQLPTVEAYYIRLSEAESKLGK